MLTKNRLLSPTLSVLLLIMACVFPVVLKSGGATANSVEYRLPVLSHNSLGALTLSRKTKVSLAILQRSFPQMRISHSVGSGDSADFHNFEARDQAGKLLFSIRSYIDGKRITRKHKQVPLQELIVSSARIRDVYGIHVGMRYSDISILRRHKLTFGQGHYQFYLGAKSIWYTFEHDEIARIRFPYDKNNSRRFQDAVKKINPAISELSWPNARW